LSPPPKNLYLYAIPLILIQSSFRYRNQTIGTCVLPLLTISTTQFDTERQGRKEEPRGSQRQPWSLFSPPVPVTHLTSLTHFPSSHPPSPFPAEYLTGWDPSGHSGRDKI
jgi:hypothetical protein